MKSGFWSAVFILAGTTIGAGIFGIPYVTAQVGYPIGLVWLVGLSVIVLLANLAYALVVLRVGMGKEYQLAGYGKYFFGRIGWLFGLAIILIGQWGALLIYLIGVGKFLAVLFNFPGSEMVFTLLFFVGAIILTRFNLRAIAAIEGWLTLGMVLITALVLFAGWQFIQPANLALGVGVASGWQKLLGPYGVMMGALMGFAVIPEVVQVGTKAKVSTKKILWAVALGTLIPAAVYLVFQYTVVGVTGAATSEDAIAGLAARIDPGVVRLGAVFGLLAMVSSFLTLVQVLRDTFQRDLQISPFRAWYLALVPPLVIYLVGAQSFILVMELTGIWFGTTTVVFIWLMYRQVRSR